MANSEVHVTDKLSVDPVKGAYPHPYLAVVRTKQGPEYKLTRATKSLE